MEKQLWQPLTTPTIYYTRHDVAADALELHYQATLAQKMDGAAVEVVQGSCWIPEARIEVGPGQHTFSGYANAVRSHVKTVLTRLVLAEPMI